MRRLLSVLSVNGAVMLALLVPVELVFGTWLRPMGMTDLKRFSIPIDTQFEFDTSSLYSGRQTRTIRYTRDRWGLRGAHRSLEEIDVLTVGGSTTEQRYLDDHATWQAVAQSHLRNAGRPLVIANAGVDGQSTVGHIFNFDFWFPSLTGLAPRVILFYIGINDVMRHEGRSAYDSTVDASSWRTKSAVYQLLRTAYHNVRARSVGVYHGRRRALGPQDFTEQGLLSDTVRLSLAEQLANGVLRNVETLRRRTAGAGATPVFMTQTALAWSGNPDEPPRGLRDTIVILGSTVNYADVSFLHRALNRRLTEYCRVQRVVCFDLARNVSFDAGDYYDYLHNTPSGASKIGQYVANRLLAVPQLADSER